MSGKKPIIGERITKQRDAIYAELKARTDHPDVDMILKGVRRRIPGISIFTVYRNLNAFERAGLIDRVATWKGRARYDGNVAPHGHFLCERCGQLVDIEDGDIEVPETRPLNGRYGEVERVTILLRGVCVKCLKMNAKRDHVQ